MRCIREAVQTALAALATLLGLELTARPVGAVGAVVSVPAPDAQPSRRWQRTGSSVRARSFVVSWLRRPLALGILRC